MPSIDPLILFYTTFFSKPVDIASIQCEVPGRWTLDKRRISEAAAVVFHIPNFREAGDAYKYPGQYWVAWSMECGQNYKRLADPKIMRHFDIIMTHESRSDVWAPYLPPAVWWKEALARPIVQKTEEAPVALFQSAVLNYSGRGDLANELARHIKIDSYGRYRNNRSVTGPDLGSKTKIETIARHKFCFAMENSIEADYVTEKIYDAFLAGTVPIYLGAPNVDEYVPENSYIDASAFASASDLAAYLQHLIETPQEYEAYFAWRSKPLPDSHAFRTANTSVRLQVLSQYKAAPLAEKGSELTAGDQARFSGKWKTNRVSCGVETASTLPPSIPAIVEIVCHVCPIRNLLAGTLFERLVSVIKLK